MKRMKMVGLLMVALIMTLPTMAQKSPRQVVNVVEEGKSIEVDYGAPSVRGRTIWGDLVPYGKVWRAGANENTTVAFNSDVTINGTKVPKGKYGFFIIPEKGKDWVLIFNKRNSDWGAYKYDEKEDVLRVKVKPEFVDDNQEMMAFKVEKRTLHFAWEKARFALKID